MREIFFVFGLFWNRDDIGLLNDRMIFLAWNRDAVRRRIDILKDTGVDFKNTEHVKVLERLEFICKKIEWTLVGHRVRLPFSLNTSERVPFFWKSNSRLASLIAFVASRF
jgi:hypothetical protein